MIFFFERQFYLSARVDFMFSRRCCKGGGFVFFFSTVKSFQLDEYRGRQCISLSSSDFRDGAISGLCWLLSEVSGDGVTERSAIGTDSRVSAMSATVLWVDLAKASWIT